MFYMDRVGALRSTKRREKPICCRDKERYILILSYFPIMYEVRITELAEEEIKSWIKEKLLSY